MHAQRIHEAVLWVKEFLSRDNRNGDFAGYFLEIGGVDTIEEIQLKVNDDIYNLIEDILKEFYDAQGNFNWY